MHVICAHWAHRLGHFIVLLGAPAFMTAAAFLLLTLLSLLGVCWLLCAPQWWC
jgi:hypothetical protein